MSIFKCKMCGGTIEFEQDATVGVCDSCGTKQTLPRLDDDKKANLYDRANHFRRNNDFDKAMGIYEQILNEDNTDAEAYWSLVLCRYGIEYVEDPTAHKRVPTVNRAQYTSVFADEDYKSALKYADSYQKIIYEEEAKAIDDIQKGILEISQKEEPFDIFICYKETDNNGRRTQDSVLANDLYHQLTQEGFKVFFSRITLEDKLGTAYEPYIFAALNSAKVMVVLGTKPEYFSAVWVKNEWSRYLALVKNSGGKKMLIPAYKDMDPYDLPEEFSHLQAQDMSKLGFMQDLIRGIKKIAATDAPKESVVVQQGGGNTSVKVQIQRGNMALEDTDWAKADSFFEEALNLDPHCAEAYLGKFLAREKKPTLDSWVQMQKAKYADATTERLVACPEDVNHINQKAKELAIGKYLAEDTIKELYIYDRGYASALSCRKKQKEKQLSELSVDRLLSRAIQYADGDTKEQLDGALASITTVLDERVSKAQEEDKNSISHIKEAYVAYIPEADKKAQTLNSEAQNHREQDYRDAVELKEKAESVKAYKDAINALKAMNGYKDSDAFGEQCEKEIDRITEAERQEDERIAEERRIAAEKAAKKRKKIIKIAAPIVATCIAFVIVLTSVIIPNSKYNSAVNLMNAGNYEEAIDIFEALDGYKDSQNQINECKYLKAISLINDGKFVEAYDSLIALGDYKDSAEIYEQYWKEQLSTAEVGDTVYFGTYEQDNDTSNGAENIEWQVLAKENNRVLVISKYVLDCHSYNATREDVTWETSTLRTWLNGTFLNSAFSETEQAVIAQETITVDKNPKYDTDPGNATKDKVFLLSFDEVNKYFSSDSARQCKPTAYAVANGTYKSYYDDSTEGNCYWWLRSPGYIQEQAAAVYLDGVVKVDGVKAEYEGVRPALWIGLA